MLMLIAGLVLFLGVHSSRVFADDARSAFIASHGEKTWKSLYAVLSIVGFVLMVYGYGATRTVPLVPLTGPVNFLDALEPQPIYQMPEVYNTNHTAVQIIKEEETLQLEAYELGGLWLIGYGHLMLEGEKDTINEEEADAFRVKDLHGCEGAIERDVTMPGTRNEFSAMVAFCYNVGSGKTISVSGISIASRSAAMSSCSARRRSRIATSSSA